MGALPSPQRIQNARAALLAVRARLLAEDPAIADDARLMIDCLDGEAGDALDIIRAMVRACRTAEAQAAGAKADAEAYADPLRERSHRLAARAKRIRTALLGVCEALKQPKWEDACFTLSVGTAPPALVVIDETLIPSEYVRTRREIDMPAALAALKNGKDVPGARLGNGRADATRHGERGCREPEVVSRHRKRQRGDSLISGRQAMPWSANANRLHLQGA